MKTSIVRLGLAAFSLTLCALAPHAGAGGAVIAWGANDFGQTNVPAGLTGVAAITAGEGCNMALRSDGTVVAWGYNVNGATNVPAGLSGVSAISAGEHGMALKNDGTVVAWGRNLEGQTNVPAGLSGVVGIAAGTLHSMALKSNGTVVAWGDNSNGKTNVPAGLSGVVGMAGSQWHSMALKSNGTVVAWGTSSYGVTSVPAGLTNVVAIAAGPYTSMALKRDGTVVTWGYNMFGQLPVPAGLSNVVAIAAASHHSAALKSDGTVVLWGENVYGQTNIPAGLGGVVAMGARNLDTIVLKPYGPAITTTGPVLPTGTLGAVYNQSLEASGGVAPHSWGIVSGRLTPGLTLSADGTISGTPTAVGLCCFRVRVTGADGLATDKGFALAIAGPLVITTSSPLASGVVGVAYNQTLTATDGAPPYTWSLAAGSLPSGLSLSGAGTVSGTPDTASTASFTVQVTDNIGIGTNKIFALTIDPPPAPGTNVVDAVTVNYAGTYVVGTNLGFNGLIVTNAGVLTSGGGVIGNSAIANNNYAAVTGVGSLWSNSGSLAVGGTGSFNGLTITDGGRVFNQTAYVGHAGAASNNAVLVAGAGSLWGNSAFVHLGSNGAFNQMTIADGGRVYSGGTYIGNGFNSSNNVVTVTGAGSLWRDNTIVVVGCNGTFNQLIVTNGGAVHGVLGYIGNNPAGNNNAALVSGAGSVWSNSSFLYVGDTAGGNRLTIADSGAVYSAIGYVGNASTSSNNTVLVTGAGSAWNNSGDLYIGHRSSGNQLTINNGGVVSNANASIGSYMAVGIQNSNTVVVDGTGSAWRVNGRMLFARRGSGNGLTVRNGGIAAITGDFQGATEAEGDNNFVTVDGSGSRMSVDSVFVFGGFGSGNTLTVTNGGVLSTASGELGMQSIGLGNTAVVAGVGSVWSSTGSLYVGNAGSFNQLTIANGGMVAATGLLVGVQASAVGNMVQVNNGNLIVTNSTGSGALDVRRGTFTLNGGTVAVNRLYLTNNASSVMNFNGGTLNSGGTMVNNGAPFTVGDTGTGSVFNLLDGTHVFGSNLIVGNIGGGNSLIITDSAQAFVNGSSIIGNSAISSSNTVRVTGTGSLWSNGADLVVGATGSFNSLTIADSGSVTNANAYIGYDAVSSNNSVTVTGSNSVWNSGSIYVGLNGSNNSLTVAYGGTISATNIVLGVGGTLNIGGLFSINPGGTLITGQLTVTNAGSSVNFYVGTLTSGGTIVSNGAPFTVARRNGLYPSTLILSGGTHSFANGINLSEDMVSGSLIVTNGAQVFVNGSIMRPEYYGHDSILVTDPGSRMVVTGNIGLGRFMAGGDQMVISNGAQVSSGGGWVGLSGFSSGNGVLITGPGSVWSNSGGLSVGLVSEFRVSDNHVMVLDGARMVTAGASIGDASFNPSHYPDSYNNSVEVSGTNSVWLNTGGVGLYSVRGRQNWLSVSNGGTVEVQGGLWNYAIVTLQDGNGVFSSFVNGSNKWYDLGYMEPVNDAGRFGMTGGTLTVSGSLSNLTSARFEIGRGDASIQSIFNESIFAQAGGTNRNSSFLNAGSGVVQHSGGQHDAGIVTNFGSWTISGAAVANLTNFVNEGNATLTVSGATLNSSLTIGNTGSFSQLTIANGGVVAGSGGIIGNSAISSNNAVFVTGTGSLWSNSGSLWIGVSGSYNSLVITNGAGVICTTGQVGGGWRDLFQDVRGTNNSVIVSGPGSLWSNVSALFIGSGGGDGNYLKISDGGTVVSENGRIGTQSGNNNSVLVTGPGSVWRNGGTIQVGEWRSGSLNIENGGTVTAANVMAGTSFSPLSDSSINVSGGNLYVTNDVQSGLLEMCAGTITLNSGTLIANDVALGINSLGSRGPFGSLNINGGNLYVTNADKSGLLEVRNGSITINSGTVTVDQLITSTNAWLSQVNFNGGLLRSANTYISNGPAIVVPPPLHSLTIGDGVQSATFQMLGGEHSFGNGLFINTNASLTGTGAITGSITNAGVIAPGDSPGVITDDGNLTLLGSATMSMELGGADASLYDEFDVTGALNFGGTLDVSLVNGYTPHGGDWFDLFDFSAGLGAFSQINLPNLDPSLYWNTNSLYTSGGISVAQAAWMTSPTNGSTFGSTSVTFAWDEGVDVSQYALWVGSASNGHDIHALLVGTNLSQTLTVPATAAPVYVRLWSFINGVWQYTDQNYTAASPVKAAMTSPAAGSTNSSASVAFAWDAGVGASQYALWVGSASNGYDLAAVATGTNLSQRVTVPATGGRIYVRLWSLIDGTWQYGEYSYTAAAPVKAAMTSPAPGATNSNASVTFTWNAGVGASQYAMWIGSVSNAYDLLAAVLGTNLTRTVTGLPVDGRNLFVRLWSCINGVWDYNDYSYRAFNAVKARFTGLGNGATLGSANVTLSWDAGAGASQYALWVGSNPGSYDLYAAIEGANLSRALTGLPTDGRRLYVRLWSLINGTWKPNDYMFTAYTAPTTRAEMLSPTNGTVLVSNPVTLNWSAGTGVSQYALWVGSTAGSYGLWAQVVGTNRTQQLTLPLDGDPVYVRLWSLVGGTWEFNDYAYETSSGSAAKAQMTSHANGDTLAAASTVFGWSAGSGVSQYAMWAGSTPGSYDLYAAALGTNRTQAVTLPVDGGPVYVRLWSLMSGTWKFNDYFYTAFLAP
ncbi:MAG: hypothetical protein HZC54_14245 [Verrucomicrobia bacterium]|nr:hypothetical protein [Verrucomicrobiota bacterium]